MSAVQRVDVPGVIDERVTISVVDGIADVKMNRADKRNALDNAMFTSLNAAGEYLKKLDGLRRNSVNGKKRSRKAE